MYSQTDFEILDSCIACGSDELVPLLDLGKQPLANSYRSSIIEPELPTFPLATVRCKNCCHVQLTHAVNPDLMFKEYLYVSGTTQTMKDHFKWFAEYACEYYDTLTATFPKSVFDIGCNDGSQLNAFIPYGIRTYGVDPATNLTALSSAKHTVWQDYFNSEFVIKNMVKVFDLIIAQNVFAHNKDPLKFLKAASLVMDGSSLLFIQTSQADMIKNGEFDTIYHEHISFFNTKSMRELCNRAGMHLVDCIKCPLHGNSYIFVVSKNREHAREANIANVLAMEGKIGLYSDKTYELYTKKCNSILDDLKRNVKLLSENMQVIGYGAAAKGMTLLNAAGIGYDMMSCVVDDNPLKQGKYTPGTNIPIVGPEYLYRVEKDVLFVPLAWNFFDEIKGKIMRKRPDNNDLFLSYFPEVIIE